MTIGTGILGLGVCYLLTNILTLIYLYLTNIKGKMLPNEERLQKIEKLLRENGLDV